MRTIFVQRAVWIIVASIVVSGCSSSKELPTASIASTENNAAAPVVSRGTTNTAAMDGSLVRLKTTAGDIVIKLDSKAAPRTVGNFLDYVRDGFYDQTIIHHAGTGMIIGGGVTPELVYKQTRVPVINEANNGRKHQKGTIALARLPEDADSGTSQFFINLTDNPAFNHQGQEHEKFGYAVFGDVVQGLEIAEKIGRGQTRAMGEFGAVPQEPVIITAAVEETLR